MTRCTCTNSSTLLVQAGRCMALRASQARLELQELRRPARQPQQLQGVHCQARSLQQSKSSSAGKPSQGKLLQATW